MAHIKILLTGAAGQLGWELQQTVPDGFELIALSRQTFDITDPDSVEKQIQHHRPDWLINAAAYTAVDKAESELDLAYAINKNGATLLANAVSQVGGRMIQISTDFVFNGKQGTPYLVDDTPDPLGVYGASKQAGDEAVLSVLDDRCAVIRTSWLYGVHGRNFVKTMLRLMAERESLPVVADQVGCPTWTRGLAQAIWRAIEVELKGIHHWSDAGVASWYDFAQAIREEGMALGLLKQDCVILPIRTLDYPALAVRPAYSVLDKTLTWQVLGMAGVHWRVQLRWMLGAMVDSQL
jgi:dTDP-4-dehydrorhamnose reductase